MVIVNIIIIIVFIVVVRYILERGFGVFFFFGVV